MIFRSRRARGGADVKERGPDRVTEEGSTLEELMEQIDALSREYRVRRDPQVGRRILQVRHLAGLRLTDVRTPARRSTRLLRSSCSPPPLSFPRSLPRS